MIEGVIELIKPDWNIFKAKFSENPQENFEWLCYLLFCNEHGQNYGLFRYTNQAGIETEPVMFEDKWVGFQAKFYETTLSSNKDEILGMLDKTKKYYPNINRIVFYTNSEWGQNKGKEPKGKIEIEQRANTLSIKIEWRCKSFFESSFVANTSEQIASHFFEESSAIVNMLESLNIHTENILSNIEYKINFNENDIVIDRSEILTQIEGMKQQAVIIRGDGGTGKTALIKSLYGRKQHDSAFYVHKATEFSIKKIEDLLYGVSLKNFMIAHQNVGSKVIVIDSAENLLNLDDMDTCIEYITALLKNGWNIYFTARNNYIEDLSFQLADIYKVRFQVINIPCLTPEGLVKLASDNNFQLPDDTKLKNLISIPFYLKKYLEYFHESKGLNNLEFRNSLWSKIINKNSPHREIVFINMAVQRANSGGFFVTPAINNQQLENALCDDGIIKHESPYGYFITHDIYEEWALEKYLESKFLDYETILSYFDEIGQSLPIRRAFRKWLSGKLENNDSTIILFIQDVLSENSIPPLWIDEVIVSILISSNSFFFFNEYKNKLLQDDCLLLKKICKFIRVACKETDSSLLKNIGLLSDDIYSIIVILTKPKGSGWESLIKFVYENSSSICKENVRFILPIIHDWNNHNKTGETTKYASLLALNYYEINMIENRYIQEDEFLFTILWGVQEISAELSHIMKQVVENKWNQRSDQYFLLSQYILSKLVDAE